MCYLTSGTNMLYSSMIQQVIYIISLHDAKNLRLNIITFIQQKLSLLINLVLNSRYQIHITSYCKTIHIHELVPTDASYHQSFYYKLVLKGP
jgi:hypothetical protein